MTLPPCPSRQSLTVWIVVVPARTATYPSSIVRVAPRSDTSSLTRRVPAGSAYRVTKRMA